MSSSKYAIGFLKLIGEILPPRKRKDVRINFIFRLIAWMRKIHSEFITDQLRLEQQAKITSHVIVFESYLVDEFGAGITITVNEVSANEAFVPHEEDNDESAFLIGHESEDDGGVYISDSDTLTLYNFTVDVPAALNADLDRMAAIIDQYKTPGSTYNIIES